MNTAKIKWNIAHFPRGSKVEFQVFSNEEPVVGNVTDIIKNGIKSWVLVTDIPGKVTEWEAYNIEHVTRIIKRGTGSCVPTSMNEYFDTKERERTERTVQRLRRIGVNKSPKTYVCSYTPIGIVTNVSTRFLNETMLVDYCKLYQLLLDRGVIKVIDTELYSLPKVFLGSKSKIKSAIKRSLKTCLLNHEEEWKKCLDEEGADYFLDLYT